MQENTDSYRSPVLHAVQTNAERLIDTGMLHFESSVAGYNERYHRGETSHTIHVWWARRPHSAMRSLVFSSICKEHDENTSKIMANLAMKCDEENLNEAKEIIKREYNTPPKILDMFGGGGTIGFEAKRLGLEAYSIDSNQLSVFIQKCNMVYADKIDLSQAEKVVESTGTIILNNLKARTEWLFPLRNSADGRPFGYMWTYRMQCPYCGKRFILSKRPWLSRKHGKRIAFVSKNISEDNSETLTVKNLQENEEPFQPAWERHTGILHCPSCGSIIKDVDVLKCEDVMTAIIKKKEGSGKEFEDIDSSCAIPDVNLINNEELKTLDRIHSKLPDSELPVWSGVVNPALYGIKTHADFLNRRQRLVLLYLIEELLNQYDYLSETDINMAKFVIGALSSLIDQVVDWNCRLSMWIPQNEQVGRGFCGPGIAMLFDYAETDQTLDGPANLWDKLNRIIKGVKSFENCDGKISVQHAHAQNLPFDDSYFDAIVTDPPYYDNIYYSILADFFYAWKKIVLERIEPELFQNNITDYKYELVASSRRVEEGKSAHEEYCKQLNMAIREASRVLKNDGIFTFVYSHSSVNGWLAVIEAYRNSNFIVNSVQPLSIERKGRPRAVLSQAVNTCVAIVARKTTEKKREIDIELLRKYTEDYCCNFGESLIKKSGWSEADAGLAVLACIIGHIANASKISNVPSDEAAVLESSKIVKKYFPDFSIKVRDSI